MESIKSAVFITSSAELSQCPKSVLPEYAFIGRSNVGKSSLINMLTGMKMLAKTSAAPGKTRLINHFLINEQWYLVDLPGYGFAKVGQQTRKKWQLLIETYLRKRSNLMSAFILVDSRLPLQENDRLVINWFGENHLPFVILMTKTDKLGISVAEKNLESFRKSLSDDWAELPGIIMTSAKSGRGKEEILSYISDSNRYFRP